MRYKLSPLLEKDLQVFKTRDHKLIEKVKKQLKLFDSNHIHPFLRTHKLSGKMSNSWSISIDRNYRMIYTLLPDRTAYFYLLGTHDEVYRK